MPGAKYTPNELELLIKHELRKTREIPEGLVVRILRNGGSWRAEAQMKASHAHTVHDADELASAVTAAGDRLAPNHPLIGW